MKNQKLVPITLVLILSFLLANCSPSTLAKPIATPMPTSTGPTATTLPIAKPND